MAGKGTRDQLITSVMP